MDDPRLLSEDLLFRRFLRERDGGDAAGAARVWEELAVRNLDRVKVGVATFRFPGGRAIPAAEHGVLLSEAYLRVIDLGANFRGHTMGELRNAMSRTVWNACMDWGRREIARGRHIAGSLDEPAYEDGEGSRFEGDVGRESVRRAADEEAEAERATYVAAVREAIRKVPNDNYREVLHMTYVYKLDAAAISTRLEITPENVYQRRRRGNLELERILRDDPA